MLWVVVSLWLISRVQKKSVGQIFANVLAAFIKMRKSGVGGGVLTLPFLLKLPTTLDSNSEVRHVKRECIYN